MNSTYALGIALTVGGVSAYALGVFVEYPGRAFSVTAVMVGFTVAAIGRSQVAEAEGAP